MFYGFEFYFLHFGLVCNQLTVTLIPGLDLLLLIHFYVVMLI